MDGSYNIKWASQAKMEFLILPKVNLPILEALKTTNIYVVDNQEFFDKDSYYYSLYFGSRFLSGQLRLQGPSMDKKTHDLWQAILQTIGKLASLYDTVDAKIFLDRYSYYLDNQE